VPVFQYEAVDAQEKASKGIVEADSAREARLKLMEQNLYLMDLRQVGDERTTVQAPFWERVLSRKRVGELSLVTRQFATLLKAGIPVADALDALVEQIDHPKLNIVFRDLREKVRQGITLEDSMRAHPRYFDPFYVNMIRVGETSGNLDGVLSRLSSYLQKQNRTRAKVSAAMVYPGIMLLIGLLVSVFLVTFVVPKITSVLSEAGQALPTPTLLLMGISNLIVGYWWAFILAVLGLMTIYRGVARTSGGRSTLDRLRLKLPLFGELIRKNLITRFARAFATLLKSGVPALEALKVIRVIMDNSVLNEAVDYIHDSVIEGANIAAPLKKSGVFPPLVGYMIAVGEESGRLEEMLEMIADYYEEEVDITTQKVTSALEPILIVFLAVVVGFIVLAVVLPILELGNIA
jgi:general secretion pathway protein F